MNIDTSNLNDESLIDMKFITRDTGMSVQWFYRLMKQDKFPKQIKLGTSSRWKYADYRRWKSNLGIECGKKVA